MRLDGCSPPQRRARVRKVVFTSSLYAYGSLGPEPMKETDVPAPTTMYGLSKVAGEHLLRVADREQGLRWTVARLFFVYGPRQYAEGGYKSVIVVNYERLRRGEAPLIHGDGEQTLDYVYVDDAVDALVAMAADSHHGGVFNVASGRGVSIAELTAPCRRPPARISTRCTTPPDWTAGSRRVGDPSLASNELGWRATMPIEEGVRRVWNWLTAEADGRAADRHLGDRAVPQRGGERPAARGALSRRGGRGEAHRRAGLRRRRSTDGTWETIEALRGRLGEEVVVGVRHEQNRGIAASWRSGVEAARGAYACFIDADLQHPPEEIVTLYRRLLESTGGHRPGNALVDRAAPRFAARALARA